MQIRRALTFPFQDDEWFTKVLRPAACLLIPLLGIFLAAGWALAVCRREIRKQTPALPGMEFRRNLNDGLAVWGIILICAMPLFLWLGLGGIIGSVLESAKVESGVFDLIWWGIEWAALGIAFAATVCAIAAIGRLAEAGSFRETFRIRRIFSSIRSAPAAFALTALAWLGLGILAVSGVAVCCGGMFFTSAFAAAAAFHLAGQAYALAAAGRASPDSPPPA
jgi:hypothetical protein